LAPQATRSTGTRRGDPPIAREGIGKRNAQEDKEMSEIDSESRILQRETDVATGYDPDAMEAAREAWLKAEAAARHIMVVADNEYFAALAAAKLSTKMDKMKPCPDADIFVTKLFVNTLSAAMNECLNPPQILDPETVRKVKDACTVAYARLTEAQILDAIDAAAAKTSQLGIVRFALLERIFDHDGSMRQQCEAASAAFDAMLPK
jgi:hypothetical protein